MDEWKLPWEGGCRCGEVRVRVTRPPMLTGACHCTGCQKMTGSAFSLAVTVPADGFDVTQGTPVIGGAPSELYRHHHCPKCMSWVFTRAEGFDWFVNLRATMLDDSSWFEPFVELWTSEKLPWAVTGAPYAYEAVPDLAEFDRLKTLYAAEGRRPG
jgi:hypothetical protein